MTKERLDELERWRRGGAIAPHMTPEEYDDLISTARRAERALDRANELPTLDDPEQMGECISDVVEILKGSNDQPR